MGKIISARLATDDYDPMNLLGTTDVFSPTKHRTIKINKKNKNSFNIKYYFQQKADQQYKEIIENRKL